jgi:hypothetical protein
LILDDESFVTFARTEEHEWCGEHPEFSAYLDSIGYPDKTLDCLEAIKERLSSIDDSTYRAAH